MTVGLSMARATVAGPPLQGRLAGLPNARTVRVGRMPQVTLGTGQRVIPGPRGRSAAQKGFLALERSIPR